MAGNWAQAILGAVSPAPPQPENRPIDTSSLMHLGELLAQKKQQNRYFEQGKQQYEEPKRQAALDQLQAALANPDDKVQLQSAIAEAKHWGIEVSGIEDLATSNEPHDHAAAPQGETETPAEDATPGEEPEYAEQPNAGKAVKPHPVPKAISDFMQNPEAQAAPAEEQATAAITDSLPNPPPVKPRPGRQLTSPGQLPPPAQGREVVISVNGQPYSRFSVDELKGYRSTQGAMVAHVFQPLVDNAGDDTAKKAAEIAQKSAVEGYNAGMSKQQAIEYGNKVWSQVAGQRFKRDWTKFPPGFKAGAIGVGGAPLSDKQALDTWKKMTDQDQGWFDTALKDYAVPFARKASARGSQIIALSNAETPIAQNVGLINILHELSGAAVTNNEAARFFEGTDIPTKIERVLRGIAGGDQPEALKAAVQEIARSMQSQSQELLSGAAEFLSQQVMTDYSSPESDEQKYYHAKRMRSLITGEKVEPKRAGKAKGSLVPVNTANSQVDDLTQ